MNGIRIAGEITEINYSHTYKGIDFYKGYILSERKSGRTDKIPFVSRTKLEGKMCLIGEVRTRNRKEEDKSHLDIYVHVLGVEEYEQDENIVIGDGYICKSPNYRITHLSRRISDCMIACNRKHLKSDYLPSISWGKDADIVGQMEVGTHINFEGRLQSRGYYKNTKDGFIVGVAYELSLNKVVTNNE